MIQNPIKTNTSFDEGWAAIKSRDYRKAFEIWRTLANQGNSEAQNKLGVMYWWGCGVPKNDAQAMEWWHKATEQGNARAQANLGTVCEWQKDYAQALIWFRKAAEQGDAGGQYNLGLMYEFGNHVPEDLEQARELYRRAAEQGNEAALIQLLHRNTSTPQEKVQALEWWRRAAEQGDARAQYEIGKIHNNGVCVPTDNTQAIAWWRRAAEQGDAEAVLNLGRMHYEGDGVQQDHAQAAAWWRKLTDPEFVKAFYYNSGDLYELSQGLHIAYAQEVDEYVLYSVLLESMNEDADIRRLVDDLVATMVDDHVPLIEWAEGYKQIVMTTLAQYAR